MSVTNKESSPVVTIFKLVKSHKRHGDYIIRQETVTVIDYDIKENGADEICGYNGEPIENLFFSLNEALICLKAFRAVEFSPAAIKQKKLLDEALMKL